jgi:hypothetical protein
MIRFYRVELPCLSGAAERSGVQDWGTCADIKGRRMAGLCGLYSAPAYVVARGFTQITDAGTTLGTVPLIVQSGSVADVGVQPGRFGLICCVSAFLGSVSTLDASM